MRDTDLFQLALGLVPPWTVEACAFDAERKRLDIEIDFKTGGRFPCSGCGKPDCPTHDTVVKEWRHLDFFQHQAFLHARTPRTECDDCGVRLVDVSIGPQSWPRPARNNDPGWEALQRSLRVMFQEDAEVAADDACAPIQLNCSGRCTPQPRTNSFI